MYYDKQAEPAPVIGYSCSGGGATIKDSPVTVNINLTINIKEQADAHLEDHNGRPTEFGRAIALLGKLLSVRDGGIAVNGRSNEIVTEIINRV